MWLRPLAWFDNAGVVRCQIRRVTLPPACCSWDLDCPLSCKMMNILVHSYKQPWIRTDATRVVLAERVSFITFFALWLCSCWAGVGAHGAVGKRQCAALCTNHHLCVSSLEAKTRSTGTVHTSAKARLTSAAISRISMSNTFMSVNHFPYLPIVTNPENNPCIQMVIRIATEIYSVLHWPIANLPCTKLLTDKQTTVNTYPPWLR